MNNLIAETQIVEQPTQQSFDVFWVLWSLQTLPAHFTFVSLLHFLLQFFFRLTLHIIFRALVNQLH
eukprot:m.224041 g.224041  ORF g.224041 m.224041 type:complete len:66 (+) comp39988_c1_seq14:2375-2572(+)